MKLPINKFAFATLTATAMSLALAGGAFADSRAAAQPTLLAANNTMEKAGEAVSDTWITSKVKSTLIADENLSGLDIEVETNQGVVTLSGTVASSVERDMAIAKAKQIEGVTAVSADGLKTAQ
ncbi:BON domain-containing protein [Pseudomonas sp. CrR25]|nr:BON domain-containing protein [Pseudomonas sp. CrR25]